MSVCKYVSRILVACHMISCDSCIVRTTHLGEIPTLQMKEHCRVYRYIHKSIKTIVTEMTIQRKGVKT